MNRASLTMSRPEYERLFASLKRFKETEGKRVLYLPGNHDAEGWWNPEIQETLREQELVDELPYYYYAASIPVGAGRQTIYCEHGNQLDPANVIEDYHDRLDTPLGYHVVTDFTRRVAPFGEISRRPGSLGPDEGLPTGGDSKVGREPLLLRLHRESGSLPSPCRS